MKIACKLALRGIRMRLLFWRGSRRRDQDFAWFTNQLSERLGPLQQRLGPTIDFSHVIREHGDEFADEMNEAALTEAIEYTRGRQGTWTTFRGRLMAEQAKRRAEQDLFSNRMLKGTFAVGLIAAAASVAALFW